MNEAQQSVVYDVALSFAGEDRPKVEELAGELRRRGISVFYDRYEQSNLWGKNLYDYLTELYTNRCKYCVAFVSRAYVTKEWTRLERSSVQARALRERAEFFLPVRLDDTDIPGLLSITAYVNLREQSLLEVADLICSKLSCGNESQKIPGTQGRLVIELCSELQDHSWAGTKIVGIHTTLLRMMNTSDARIIGFECFPHRVQIQTTSEGYSNLRTKFLSGDLDAKTDTKWTGIGALEGKERAPAPTQVPLAQIRPARTPDPEKERSVVCHLSGISGFYELEKKAKSSLGSETTTDWKKLKAYIGADGDCLYVHSNFIKPGCEYTTKIATNLPVDLFTLFINLTFLELPEENEYANAEIAHTKYAQYLVERDAIGRKGDEFYSGAMNIRFV